MKRLMFLIAFLMALAPAVQAQEIVTDISQYDIELRHSFTGQELLLFGAIKGGEELGAGSDVVIIISGEERTQLVRKKEKVMGVWVNSEGEILENVPGYYALASTRPLQEIASEDVLLKLKLGLRYQDFTHQRGLEDYAAGLIRVKENAKLFPEATEEMTIQSETLFRADFFFPANVPSGSYLASAYLFRDGQLIGRSDKEIKIGKAGFERVVYNLAQDQPYLYGLMAIIVALLAGWLAAFITRPKSRLG